LEPTLYIEVSKGYTPKGSKEKNYFIATKKRNLLSPFTPSRPFDISAFRKLVARTDLQTYSREDEANGFLNILDVLEMIQ